MTQRPPHTWCSNVNALVQKHDNLSELKLSNLKIAAIIVPFGDYFKLSLTKHHASHITVGSLQFMYPFPLGKESRPARSEVVATAMTHKFECCETAAAGTAVPSNSALSWLQQARPA